MLLVLRMLQEAPCKLWTPWRMSPTVEHIPVCRCLRWWPRLAWKWRYSRAARSLRSSMFFILATMTPGFLDNCYPPWLTYPRVSRFASAAIGRAVSITFSTRLLRHLIWMQSYPTCQADDVCRRTREHRLSFGWLSRCLAHPAVVDDWRRSMSLKR